MSSKSGFACIFLFSLLALLNGLAAQTESIKYEWAHGMGSDNETWGFGPPPGPPPAPLLERGQSLVVDKAGNVYITGAFLDTVDFDPSPVATNLISVSPNDLFVAKYSPTGLLLWVKQIGNEFNFQESTAILINAEGDLYLTGTFRGKVDFDVSADTAYLFREVNHPDASSMFIASYDQDFNFLWAKEITGRGDLRVSAATLSETGDLFISGIYYGPFDFDPSADTMNVNNASNGGGFQPFIASYTKNGAFKWFKDFGGPGICSFNNLMKGISTDSANNVFLTGTFCGVVDFNPADGQESVLTTGPGGMDSFVAKLDSSGNYKWAFKIEGTGPEEGPAVVSDRNGIVTIAGSFRGNIDFDPSPPTTNHTSVNGDLFLASYDQSGNLLWVKQISGDSLLTSNHQIELTPGGQLVVSGKFSGWGDFDPSGTIKKLEAESETDIFIAKYTASGDYLWAKEMGSLAGTEVINSLAADSSETIYVTGSFSAKVDFDPGTGVQNRSSTGYDDIFVGKYSACTTEIAPASIDFETCNGYVSPSGLLLDQSGTYLDAVTGSSGCDSIIVIHLTLNHTFRSVVAEECLSYTAPDSVVYTTSGVKTALLVNSTGCDSIITINLTIKNTQSNLMRTACKEFIAPDGSVLTTSGTYALTIPNAAGCDSTIHINLTIRIVSNTVSENGPTLTADEAGASTGYRWLDCNEGYMPIPGETSQSFTALLPGRYAVAVSKNGCVDTSSCYLVQTTGVPGIMNREEIQVYPNPFADQLIIDFGNLSGMFAVEVFDLPGQLVFRKQMVASGKMELDFPSAPGVYFIQVTNQGNQQTLKAVKK